MDRIVRFGKVFKDWERFELDWICFKSFEEVLSAGVDGGHHQKFLLVRFGRDLVSLVNQEGSEGAKWDQVT